MIFTMFHCSISEVPAHLLPDLGFAGLGAAAPHGRGVDGVDAGGGAGQAPKWQRWEPVGTGGKPWKLIGKPRGNPIFFWKLMGKSRGHPIF